MVHENLLGGPEPIELPEDPAASEAPGDTADERAVSTWAARFPASSAVWAELADRAWARGATVESYAYARTGYHRGLDALRRNGWRGSGPVPWEHEPNRGFLRSLSALGRAAAAIGEVAEAERCRTFLADCSPTAVAALSRTGPDQ